MCGLRYLDGIEVGVDECEGRGGACDPEADGGDEGVRRVAQLLRRDDDQRLEDPLTLDEGLEDAHPGEGEEGSE